MVVGIVQGEPLLDGVRWFPEAAVRIRQQPILLGKLNASVGYEVFGKALLDVPEQISAMV